MGVRIDVHQSAIDALLASPPIRKAVRDIAEAVQTEAVRLNVAELVDTGRMASSWRITEISVGRRYFYRVHNTARSPAKGSDPGGANYPYFWEWGWHTRSGRHMPAHRIAQRAAAIRFF